MTTSLRIQQVVARAGVRLFVLFVFYSIVESLASKSSFYFWKIIHADVASHVAPVEVCLLLTIVTLWSISFSPRQDPHAGTTALAEAAIFIRSTLLLVSAAFLSTEIVDVSLLRLSMQLVTLILFFELCRAIFRWLSGVTFANTSPQRAVILGSGRRASKAWREIRLNNHPSVDLLGFVDDRDPSQMAPDILNRLICNLEELRAAIIVNQIDRVYVAMPLRSCYDKIQKAIDVATSLGVQVLCMEDVYTTTDRQMVLTDDLFRDLVPKTPRWSAFRTIKRLVDVVGAGIGLIVSFPVGILIAMRIKSSSPGPVFVSEERLGQNGRRFKMLKFRTFDWPVEGTANSNRIDAFLQGEARTTRLGSMLRATSLDELAQFWNVLKGEMSLVGPRPISIGDAFNLSDTQIQERLKIKPGITGLWQVSGRSTLNRNQGAAMDNRYIKERSLRLDLAILLRTIPAVAKKTGAA